MRTTSKVIVGIDYSMSSPSICVHRGKIWSFSNCKFYYLTDKKKHEINTPNIIGERHLDYTCQEERYDNISTWAISKIPKKSIIYLEDYAFAAKGVVFNIGECCGILKHKLWSSNYSYGTFAPSQIKKFATTKGNATKMFMHESFIEETQFDISAVINCHEGESPMSDIIDSYYIAKFAHCQFIK
jgi:Holliday junction resolvasome RuvABC endonuclease subunit